MLVFLGGDVFAPHGPSTTAVTGMAFAVALCVSHVANLAIPLPAVQGGAPSEIAALGVSTLVLTIPFVLSGMVVTLALTRTGAPVGGLYGADWSVPRVAASVIVILETTDITSSALSNQSRRVGAYCLRGSPGPRAGRRKLVIMFFGCGLKRHFRPPLGMMYPKSQRSGAMT